MKNNIKNKKDYELKEIKLNPNLEVVKNEIEYWEKHKYYNRKLKKLSRNLKKFVYHPDEYINEFENILIDCVSCGVFSLDFANDQRKLLYNNLNYKHTFKTWINTFIKKKKTYK